MATLTHQTELCTLPHQYRHTTRLPFKRRGGQQSFLEQRERHRRRSGSRGIQRAQTLLLLPVVRPPFHPLRNAPPPLLDLGIGLVPSSPSPLLLPEPDAGHLSLRGSSLPRQRPLPHTPTPRPLSHTGRARDRIRHNNAGCDDLCKGELSSAGIAMRQAITQVVLDEFENAGPSYAPRSPSPDYDYVPGENEGSN
jgi:hypothetical protein